MMCLISVLLFSILLSASTTSFLLSLMVSVVISLGMINMYFNSSVDLVYYSCSLSGLMVGLTCLLCFLSTMTSTDMKNSFFYNMSIKALCLVLVLAFSSSSALMFYVYFEISLIPTLILIIGWGYQPERLQAGSYMMMYTVSASLPLLVVILYFGYKFASLDFNMFKLCSGLLKGPILMAILMAFIVKLPGYGVHLWLPKAHVEAPLAGSMLLAGILLKLGGFGIFQFKVALNLSGDTVSLIVVSLGMWGGLLASLMCMRQMDIKSFVAYSSVGHMSIVIAGLLLDSSWGVFSAVVTMVAHGFSSSAMFCLAYFSYVNTLTRNIPYMRGFLQVAPYLSLWWFIFCCINMACPPTLNLMGELMVVPALQSAGTTILFVMGLMVFFSAAYNMYLYSAVNHGTFSGYIMPNNKLKSNSMVTLFGHLFPLMLILNSNLFNIS